MNRFRHVPLYDYAAEYREIRVPIDHVIHRVLESGRYENGAEVEAFQAEFSEYLGLPYAVTTGSCYDAMYQALKALDIGPGDQVATVANTCVACTAAIHRTGAEILFVDVREDTYNVNPEDLAARITPKTRAVLVVHMYGYPAEVEAIARIAKRHDLLVIEDCALAVGATVSGRRVGTFGHVGCFSHAPSKILGTYGTGGSLVTSDRQIAERASHMHLYRQTRDRWIDVNGVRIHSGFHLVEEGFHSGVVEWTAAVLRVKLTRIEAWIDARRRVAAAYTDRLRDLDLVLPVEEPGMRHVFRNYVVRVPTDREIIRHRLAEQGVETGMHYVPPLHLQPVYAHLGGRPGDLPITERISEGVFGLPIYPQLAESQIDWVAEALRRSLTA